jgi:hypothetical protein
MFSAFFKYKKPYLDLLEVILPSTTLLGFTTGLFSNMSMRNRDAKSIESFTDLIGYTTIGVITGFTYPISFPLLGGYVLYKNYLLKN